MKKEFSDELQKIVDNAVKRASATTTAWINLKSWKDILSKNPKDKDIEDAIDMLKELDMRRYISYLARTYDPEQWGMSDMDFQNLQNLIYILQVIYNYSKGESPVSDYDYDKLYEKLKTKNIEVITTPVISSSKIVLHKYKTLRGTLKKVYALGDESMANNSRKSLDDWISECEKAYKAATGNVLDLNSQEVYVFPKWDGVSVVFEFDERNRLKRALTRGYTETNEAQDVTSLFRSQQFIIKDSNMAGQAYGLKTEVMMSEKEKDSYNKKYGTDYKNTRSIVSAIINSDAIDGRENLLEVIRLRTSVIGKDGEESLQELASNVFERPYLRCPLSERSAIRKFANSNKVINGLHTDGVVIYIIDEDIRKVLGRKDHKNQYEVAYKFNEEVGYTKIKDIEFTVTPYGRIFPVALLKEITLKGNTISRVSLGSIDRMKKLFLAKGDTVKILYEIVPYLVWDDNDPKCKRSGNFPIQLPEVCPECGEELEILESTCICTNQDCPSRMRGKIIRFADTCRIKGLGESTIKSLMQAGLVYKISDIYRLHLLQDKVENVKGFDKVSTANLLNEIENHRCVEAYQLLAGIGIESIGKKTFGKIFQRYTIDELIDIADDSKLSLLASIPTIGEVQAVKIMQGIKAHKKLIKDLLKEVTPLYNNAKFIAVFHKVRSDRLTDIITRRGGRVDDDLTKDTTFLIVPDNFGESSTSTSNKARKYGVPIIEYGKVEEFIDSLDSSSGSTDFPPEGDGA